MVAPRQLSAHETELAGQRALQARTARHLASGAVMLVVGVVVLAVDIAVAPVDADVLCRQGCRRRARRGRCVLHAGRDRDAREAWRGAIELGPRLTRTAVESDHIAEPARSLHCRASRCRRARPSPL
jgi:hypothetical protein